MRALVVLLVVVSLAGCMKQQQLTPGANREVTGTVEMVSTSVEYFLAGTTPDNPARQPRPVIILTMLERGRKIEVACKFDTPIAKWHSELSPGDTFTARGVIESYCEFMPGENFLNLRQCEYIRHSKR